MGEKELGKKERDGEGRRRGIREGDKEGVKVKRRKEEEREGTKGERKITFCRVRGEREGERERKGERVRELVGRKREGES